jgi:hypothetical protein
LERAELTVSSMLSTHTTKTPTFEASKLKNADLARGFTQLAVELIALDQWTDSTVPMLYGTVTTGDTWKFAIFQRQEKIVHKDINTYAIPSDLNWVLSTLFGISLS